MKKTSIPKKLRLSTSTIRKLSAAIVNAEDLARIAGGRTGSACRTFCHC